MASRAEAAAETAELRSPGGSLEATFVPRIGMLGWSLRHDGEELLGHPVTLDRYAATGEPTGIPVLHPWANRLASPEFEVAGRRVRLDMNAPNVLKDPNGLPMHGLVGGSPNWELLEVKPTRIRAWLDYAAWPELARGFPFRTRSRSPLTYRTSGSRSLRSSRPQATGRCLSHSASIPICKYPALTARAGGWSCR